MSKIISFIKSINMKEKLDDPYKGWGYLINIEDSEGETHQIGICSDKISYNNSFYTADISVSEKITDIYNKLNYPEIDPLS
ncbi:hypothetical protein [Clostridium cibarium]|nr:hypothetical protein [Clostridium cibarium]